MRPATVLLIIALLLSEVVAVAQSPVRVQADSVLDDTDALREFYPRHEGTANEQRTIDFIAQRLTFLGAPYERRSLGDLPEAHSFSTTVEVTISGELPDTLLIIVPINHPLDASPEADGAVNIALALGVVESLIHGRPPITVKVLFMGAEYGVGAEYPIGTREFLTDYYPEAPVTVLYMGFQRYPSRILLETGGQGVVAPYWLIERYSQALRRTRLFFLVMGNKTQVSRLGLSIRNPLIDPYLKAEIPAIKFEGIYRETSRAEKEAWLFSFFLFVEELLNSNAGGFLDRWDRHYLFFQARSQFVIIGEQTFVLAIIGVLVVSLVYGLLFPDHIKRYLKTMWRNIFDVPFLVFITFLFLFLATLALEAVLRLRNMPDLWARNPVAFLVLKLSVALLLFSLLVRYLKQLPFSHNSSFYTASALFLLLINVIILSVIDVSFSYYAVWAFFFAFLYSLAPWRAVKVLAFLLSPIWLLKAAYDVFTLPELEVCRTLLLSRTPGNLLLAVILLPFLLMLIRLDFMIRHPILPMRRLVSRFSIVVLAAVAVGVFSSLVAYAPFTASSPQRVTVREEVDLDAPARTLTLESDAPLTDVRVVAAGSAFDVSTRERRLTVAPEGVPEMVAVDTTIRRFLDRKLLHLRLLPVGSPYRIRLKLQSDESIILFDSNYPFSLDPATASARIHIGANPPVPVDVRFTVPEDQHLVSELIVEYLELPSPIAVEGPRIEGTTRLTVRKTIPMTDQLAGSAAAPRRR